MKKIFFIYFPLLCCFGFIFLALIMSEKTLFPIIAGIFIYIAWIGIIVESKTYSWWQTIVLAPIDFCVYIATIFICIFWGDFWDWDYVSWGKWRIKYAMFLKL